MHPISLVGDADFDDSADVDGEKTFPIETPSKISQRRSINRICQTVQFLSLADENVVSVFGSYEPFA